MIRTAVSAGSGTASDFSGQRRFPVYGTRTETVCTFGASGQGVNRPAGAGATRRRRSPPLTRRAGGRAASTPSPPRQPGRRRGARPPSWHPASPHRHRRPRDLRFRRATPATRAPAAGRTPLVKATVSATSGSGRLTATARTPQRRTKRTNRSGDRGSEIETTPCADRRPSTYPSPKPPTLPATDKANPPAAPKVAPSTTMTTLEGTGRTASMTRSPTPTAAATGDIRSSRGLGSTRIAGPPPFDEQEGHEESRKEGGDQRRCPRPPPERTVPVSSEHRPPPHLTLPVR